MNATLAPAPSTLRPLSARLRRTGKVAILDPPLRTSDRQHRRDGMWRTSVRNGLFLLGVIESGSTTRPQRAPKVRQQASPGQRPGSLFPNEISPERAAQNCHALSGLGRLSSVYPGRCPGLACCWAFGPSAACRLGPASPLSLDPHSITPVPGALSNGRAARHAAPLILSTRSASRRDE